LRGLLQEKSRILKISPLKGERALIRQKINIGCGLAYKSGYLNLDSNPDSVADIIASAEFLPLRGSSCKYVESFQTIEHFGVVTAEKILIEWWHILAPGGILVIETVDLASSISNLRGNNPKGGSAWLYGVEETGMTHGRCYSFPEFKALLRKLGFVSIRKEKPQGIWQTGAMRITCVKSPKTHHWRFVNRIRSRIIELLGCHQTLYSDIQNTLERHFTEGFNPQEFIIDALVISPDLGVLIIEELLLGDLLDTSEEKKWQKVTKFLNKVQFPGILASVLMDLSRKPREQQPAFLSVRKLGKEAIRAVCRNETQAITRLKTQKALKGVKYFCSWEIEQLALSYAAKAVRQFSMGNWVAAVRLFIIASKLNSDNLLAYWNLARLHRLLGNTDRSKKAYNLASMVTARKELQKEAASSEILNSPVEMSHVYTR
jgi:hypothetical protein